MKYKANDITTDIEIDVDLNNSGTTSGSSGSITFHPVTSTTYSTINPLFPYWLNPYKLYEFVESIILSYEPNQSVFSYSNEPKYKILEYEP